MADTVAITEGVGTDIATDDVGGTHYQEVKLVDGTKDSATPIAVDVGVKANALRVAPANDITDGTYIGDIKFGEALAAGTALIGKVSIDQVTANANEVVAKSGTITTVSTVTNLAQLGGTAITMDEGAHDAGCQRVTIATDDDGVAHLSNISTYASGIEAAVELLDNALYVDDADWTDDSSSHLLVGGVYQSTPHTVTDGDVSPIELDANGKILVSGMVACNTGAVVISSGTVTTVSTVTNLSQMAGTAISMDEGGADAGTQRVTIANDDVVADSLSVLDDWDDANYCNVNMNVAGTDVAGGAGVLSAQTIRVTIATDDECNNFLGTIDADTSNIATYTTGIETAVEIMDDWDATHASAAPADGVCIMGAGYSAGLPTDIGADADAARICTDRYGRVLAGIMPQAFQATIASADAQAATAVKAKTADRKMYILSLIASTDTALDLQFQDDTGPTVLIENIHLAANGGFTMQWPPEAPLTVNTNEDFDVIASAAGNISVTITGYLAP